MRADRLVSLMMLLQSRPRTTVGELAARLQVAVRTVHRDLDALSASGVPVSVTRGAKGGVSLLDGWKTSLTGLTRREVHALAGLGAPGAFDDLDLAEPLRSALVKLSATLPVIQRATAEHARQRLLVDPSPWFGEREPVPHLEKLREAAWQDRRVRLGYRDLEGARSTRLVDPYALVVKAERWYLVAGTADGVRVFRGARIERAALLQDTFARPASFDLPRFWRDWCRRFGEKRASYVVTLRLDAKATAALAEIRPPSDRARLDSARPGRDGTRRVEIDFEREHIAVSQLAEVGGGFEVVAPEPLRARLAALGEALVKAHARQAARG